MKELLAMAICFVAIICNAAEFEFHRDINYRPDATGYTAEMTRLDIAQPVADSPKDVVVWFHGGGLVGGRREIPAELLDGSVVIVGVEYRMFPNATIDEILDDSALAVAWVINNISNYNGNPERIFLSGHSAGGYIVDMLGLDKSWLAKYNIDADAIKGIVPFSGQKITHYEVRRQQGIDPLQPTIDRYAPLYHVRKDCPPMLVISGDREMELYGRYEEQAYFLRMMKLVGHPDVTLYELDGYDHGGMARPAFPLLLRFIHTH